MPVAEVNGQSLYYEVKGEGEPLLCVQGLSADHHAWMNQVPAFSERFRTIVFDNRDVGRSSYADGPYEVTDMAADTMALADELGLDSFHLLGISLGGTISQEVALAIPERVRTLTLCATWPRSGGWGPIRARTWGAAVMRRSREERADEMLLLTLTEDFFEDPERVERARQMILANPNPQQPEAFVRQLEAGSRHDAADRLPNLGMPVHVIGAEQDMLVPVWKSRHVAELIPGARLTVIEGATHGFNMQHPQEFNRAVLEFVEAHAGVAV